MNALQEKLFQQQDLTQDEAFEVFSQFVNGDQDPVTIAAFLVALKIKQESPTEVAGAAQALRTHARHFERPQYPTADSCGTGGSGKHTLNISTLVSVIAAVKGIKMVKHGNRSISSKCGSADVLEQLGVKVDMSPETAKKCLDQLNLTFLFAPLYHPGVRHVMPVRNTLKTRTIFNLIGPLANPAAPEFQLMGVYSPEYCFAAAESLRLSGCKGAMVVHSCGCDEITLAGTTHVAELKNDRITQYTLSPEDFGLKHVPLETLVGGTPEQNAEQFVAVLKGGAPAAVLDTVAANAGALFYLSGQCKSLQDGVQSARQIMRQGTGLVKILSLAELSQSDNTNFTSTNGDSA